MKSLVDGECGGPNALVSLASNYGQSNNRILQSTPRGVNSLLPSFSRGDEWASEILSRSMASAVRPNTFNMMDLVQQIPQKTISTRPSALALQWSDEFASTRAPSQLAVQWKEEFCSTGPSTVSLAIQPSLGQRWATELTGASFLSGPRNDTSMWSSEFLDSYESSSLEEKTSNLANEWRSEFVDNHEEALWKKLETEWLKQREGWAADGLENQFEQGVYIHQSVNPFLQTQNPRSVGDEAMMRGDLEQAILAYEAATQANPEDTDAWCRLGLSHAENEDDKQAIQAFRKAIQIDPRNKEIEKEFLSAAAKQGSTIDPVLQNALGVFYNLGDNYGRAIDSIELAIAAQPNDARLWNRLGATLANGDRTPEAVAAYREALRLHPSYPRARYNLGISCMRLSSYREAVEHFTSALELQRGGGKENSSIWQPLRSSAIRCLEHASTLLPLIDQKNLPALRNALQSIPVTIT